MTHIAEDVLLARAYLGRVSEPAHRAVWEFVETVGPVEAARRIGTGDAPAPVVEATEARRGCDPQVDLDAAARYGLRLVVPESDEWPHFAFAALHNAATRYRGGTSAGAANSPPSSASGRPPAGGYAAPFAGSGVRPPAGELVPPLALWAKGDADLPSLAVRSVGIVGARAATAYGDHVARDLAFGLARAEVVVVSGGAYGIDAAAHLAALAAGGCTVLVSAGGLDRPYPPSHAALYQKVAASGLLLSESPPGCAPQRHRFLTRNRLIAALSTGVLVVEAALRSGAANTASHAAALGRTVMAVPGPVTSPMSAGCHRLLRLQPSPAVLVTCVEDVLAVVGSAGEGLGKPEVSNPAADVRDELERLDPDSRRVFDGLPSTGFFRVDEIAVRSGLPAAAVLRALPLLDLADLIEGDDDGYRIAARLRRRRGVAKRG
jgi:DNA processing protein